VSLRTASKTGYPIVHAERVLGRVPSIDYDKSIDDTILKGEIYGVDKNNKPIPLQHLSGILNSAPYKAMTTKNVNDVALKVMLYDIARHGGNPVDIDKTPYEERHAILNDIVNAYLPKDTFHVADTYSGNKAESLYNDIETGNHPLTNEGIVIHPQTGKPYKLKTVKDFDVFVKNVFPGEGKYSNSAGGFTYSLEPNGKEIGKVGTGFDDAYRNFMWNNKEDFAGRKVRIKSPEQLTSGAYRHPVFISTHEG
jgi:ATP-dependent DNA ligase